MDNLIVANVKQRPLRTGISIIGVALGVILVVLVVGLARGTMRDSAERQTNVDAELRFFPSGLMGFSTGANPMTLPVRYADAIANGIRPTAEDPDIEPKPPVPGVAAVSPVGEYLHQSGAIGYEIVDGIDFESFTKVSDIRIVEGRALTDGRSPETQYEAIVDRFYAENNKGTDGRPVTIGSEIAIFGHDFKVVGIYEPSMLARVKIPLYTLQQILGGADNCSFLLIRTERPEMAVQVKKTIDEFYPGHNVLLTEDLPALYSQGIGLVEVFLNVVIGLAVVISTLVILLAMYTTIIERTREIGVLKSLGASKLFIVSVIEKEAALISALGVAFGFLVSVVAKFVIEGTTRLTIDLQIEWLLIAAAIGVLGGIVGALYPAFRAANLDPIEALNYE
ncbi:MAG TPA: ABC transporter permease [Blastocatellia bacterium]|nr:ABC transporter permease [Blastocatellia bacterium]